MKKTLRALKGDICYSQDSKELITVAGGYLVYQDGKVVGVFAELPSQYQAAEIADYSGQLIIPGLIDLHIHAPQYAFRGLGMDLELLEWLNTNAFVEEAKYQDLAYAQKAYRQFVEDLKRSGTTRASIFGTIHVEATKLLMDLLEEAGIFAYVGKVNMTRNSPPNLTETAEQSAVETRRWIEDTQEAYQYAKPILTPRFIPSCGEDIMFALSKIQQEYGLPLQSHLSENLAEIELVKELAPEAGCYGDVYAGAGLFGMEVPTIMAHCVHSDSEEIAMMKERGVYVAHCPQSNTNLASGIAPIRRYLDEELLVGLGSDVAGGAHMSIFRAMTDAIQVSKLRYTYVDRNLAPITMEEAFYMGTRGGGRFFGQVGSFEAGYEMDALVLNEREIPHPQELTLRDRLERFLYLTGPSGVSHKYIGGKQII